MPTCMRAYDWTESAGSKMNTKTLIPSTLCCLFLAVASSSSVRAEARLIAEDSAFSLTNRFDAGYRAQLTWLLVPDDHVRWAQFVSEGDRIPEESFYISADGTGIDRCSIVSNRLATSFRLAYRKEYYSRLKSKNFNGIVDILLPAVDRRTRFLPGLECERVRAVWTAALARLTNWSEWINELQNCRNPENKCERVLMPDELVRYEHFSNSQDDGSVSGYARPNSNEAPTALESLAYSLIEYVRAPDASVETAHAAVQKALKVAQGVYAIKCEGCAKPVEIQKKPESRSRR
jgi:hypothetical protein